MVNTRENRPWSLGTVFAAALVVAALMTLAALASKPAAAHSGDPDREHTPSDRAGFDAVKATNSDVVKAANETGTGINLVKTAIENSARPTVHDVTVEFGTAESFPAASSYECRIDGGSWEACTSPVTYGGLALGVEHAFEVRGSSKGVTGSPVASTWTAEAGAAPEQGLGFVIAEGFYALNLDGVFGHVLGEEYAGLSGDDHHGSPAYSGSYAGGGHDVGFLGWGSSKDSIVRACNQTHNRAPAYSYGRNTQARQTHVAVARKSGSCNNTYTNANHEWHYTSNNLGGRGAISYHR